jgi:hypothetical protein
VHRVPSSNKGRLKPDGRTKRAFSFIKSALAGVRRSGAGSAHAAARYNRVSAMDISVTGGEKDHTITGAPAGGTVSPSGRGMFGMNITERSVELSPIHDPAEVGYDSIETTDVSTTEITSPASVNSPRRGVDGQPPSDATSPSAAPTAVNRAQDEEEMIRARIELASRTPWREFVTNPVALVLLAANFQYVSTRLSTRYVYTVY